MRIYKKTWAWPLDLALHLQSMAQVKCLDAIEDGALRFCHVTHEEEASRDLIHPIVNRRLRFVDGSSNLGRYNSSYEWLGLIY